MNNQKKLYTVTVYTQYVIAVDDDESPFDVAYDCFSEAISDVTAEHAIESVDPFRGYPDCWDDQCLPYGSNDNVTIGEYVKDAKQ